MALADEGMSPEAIFSHLDELKIDDVRWRDGRAFTLAYYGGAEVLAVAEEAYRKYSSENALNTDAFPSLRTMQAEVVGVRRRLAAGGRRRRGLHDVAAAPRASCMAVKAARERGRPSEFGIDEPNIVLADQCPRRVREGLHYFGLREPARPGCAPTGGPTSEAMDAAIDDEHRARRRLRAAVPAGRDRPDRRDRRARRGARHQLPRRRVHGRRHAPLPRAARRRVPPWNFAVDGRDEHLGRPAQVRLHGQGRRR